MITGILKKFEPTEKGITILIQTSDDQLQEIVALFKQPVVIVRHGDDVPQEQVDLKALKGYLEKVLEELG